LYSILSLPHFSNSENAKYDVFSISKCNDTLQDGANINHLIGLWGNSSNKTVPLNSEKLDLISRQRLVLIQNPQSDSIKLRIKLMLNPSTIRDTETDWIYFK